MPVAIAGSPQFRYCQDFEISALRQERIEVAKLDKVRYDVPEAVEEAWDAITYMGIFDVLDDLLFQDGSKRRALELFAAQVLGEMARQWERKPAVATRGLKAVETLSEDNVSQAQIDFLRQFSRVGLRMLVAHTCSNGSAFRFAPKTEGDVVSSPLSIVIPADKVAAQLNRMGLFREAASAHFLRAESLANGDRHDQAAQAYRDSAQARRKAGEPALAIAAIVREIAEWKKAGMAFEEIQAKTNACLIAEAQAEVAAKHKKSVEHATEPSHRRFFCEQMAAALRNVAMAWETAEWHRLAAEAGHDEVKAWILTVSGSRRDMQEARANLAEAYAREAANWERANQHLNAVVAWKNQAATLLIEPDLAAAERAARIWERLASDAALSEGHAPAFRIEAAKAWEVAGQPIRAANAWRAAADALASDRGPAASTDATVDPAKWIACKEKEALNWEAAAVTATRDGRQSEAAGAYQKEAEAWRAAKGFRQQASAMRAQGSCQYDGALPTRAEGRQSGELAMDYLAPLQPCNLEYPELCGRLATALRKTAKAWEAAGGHQLAAKARHDEAIAWADQVIALTERGGENFLQEAREAMAKSAAAYAGEAVNHEHAGDRLDAGVALRNQAAVLVKIPTLRCAEQAALILERLAKDSVLPAHEAPWLWRDAAEAWRRADQPVRMAQAWSEAAVALEGVGIVGHAVVRLWRKKEALSWLGVATKTWKTGELSELVQIYQNEARAWDAAGSPDRTQAAMRKAEAAGLHNMAVDAPAGMRSVDAWGATVVAWDAAGYPDMARVARINQATVLEGVAREATRTGRLMDAAFAWTDVADLWNALGYTARAAAAKEKISGFEAVPGFH